jgi:low affinity Fe/Cu permease
MTIDKRFAAFANSIARVTGSPWAFCLCVLLVLAWAVTGPVFHFSETWQLVINTGTTIVTFLMVFLIQNTQNRDGAALQAKLDELILTSKAENVFIGIEKLTDKELDELREHAMRRAKAHQDFQERVTVEIQGRSDRQLGTATGEAGQRRPRRRATHEAR